MHRLPEFQCHKENSSISNSTINESRNKIGENHYNGKLIANAKSQKYHEIPNSTSNNMCLAYKKWPKTQAVTLQYHN